MERPSNRILLVGFTILVVVVFAFAWLSHPPDRTAADELRQLLARGEYAAAEQRARQELATLTRNGTDASVPAGEVLDVLVTALYRGGKASHDEAMTFAEQAIAIKEKRLGANDPALATSLDNAGVLYFLRGDYVRARHFYERALSIWETAAGRATGYEADLGKAHSHLGPLFQELGQYSAARRHYEQALEAFVKAIGPDDPQVAMTRNNLATLMVKIGDYDEALRLYRQSQAGLEAQLGSTHPLIANAKHNLAELNQRMGRNEEAIELYRQSIALKEKSLGATHPSLALSLGNLSYLYSDRGEIEASEPLARRALEIHTAAYGAEHVDLAYSLISLGRAQAARGDTAAASETLRRALDLRATTLGADNPLLVQPLFFLSETLFAGGRHREAFELALDAESIARAHLRLTARGAPERQALRYSAERLSSLDVVLSTAAHLADAAISSRSWDALIRSRAVVLDEMATRHRLAARQTHAPLREAFDAYRSAAERLSNLQLRGPAADAPERFRERIASLRAEVEGAERAVAAQSETVRHGLEEQEIGYDAVLDALPDNTTLVAFARIGRGPRSRLQTAEYVAFVLDSGQRSPRVVSLGAARDIETAIRRWRDEMTLETASAAARGDRAAGDRVRRLLWDPLQLRAAGDRLILIVPDAAIHLVNFAALPLPQGRFLAESDVLIQYLASERDLIVGEQRSDKRQLLVVGGAGMGASPIRSVPHAARLDDCRTWSAADFPPLPGSLREARQVASIWAAAKQMTDEPAIELIDALATKSAFKRQAQGKTVVHVATHGFFSANRCLSDRVESASPLRLSGLVFAAETGANGILLAEEVATMDFSHASWVVLSGCDTGVGEIRTDEGIVGLRRAFRVAGAATLIMSLWPVEDLSAEAFMTSLYHARLSAGRSTAASIRQAYRDALAATRRAHGQAHPLYWAPFIASGDWR